MARILIADDDRLIHRIYAKTLDFLGHEKISVYDGKSAVKAVSSGNIDLIILDNEMPEMDGYEACRLIRKMPDGITVPIIVVSARDTQEEILNFFNAGANDYLLKPITETILIAKLKNFLKTSSLNKNELNIVREQAVIADHYKISKILGYGSHSVVFLANDLHDNNRNVAIKLLNQNVVTADLVKPITNTAVKLKNAELENVTKIYDFGSYGHNFYFVFEYADGGDLAKQIKQQGTLSEAETSIIGIDLAKALCSLKQNNIQHLDIKPENILIHNGTYKLSDFGIASQRANATISINPEIWGTPAYSAPEIFTETDNITCACDVYSLGCVLYEALIGDNPFYSDRPTVSMFRQTNLHPASLMEMKGRFSAEISIIIDMMLAKDPATRPTPEELEKSFHSINSNIGSGKKKLTYLNAPTPHIS